MSKITLNNVGDGSFLNASTAAAQINANNGVIQTAFDNTLSLDGTSPNKLLSLIDMNSQQIINLPAPATTSSPLRLQDLSSFVGGGTVTSIPAGGTTNQALTKHSNANYDVQFSNVVSSVGLSMPSDFNVTNSPVTGSGTLAVTLATTATGTGGFVRQTSPTLVTPALGTPASATLSNATGLPVSTGISGLATGVATFLATPTSANIAATVTDETGSGALVFATSPTLVTPILGTPTSGTLTNTTGLPISTGVSGLAAGVATFLATPTSANLATAVTNETGSGSLVFGTSPTLVTPVLGAATATTINGATIDNLAWTSYTPTVTAATGIFTTVSATGRYKQLGKTIWLEIDITITTAGTAAGVIQATTPFTAAAFNYIGNAMEYQNSGKSGACRIGVSGTTCNALDASAATFIATSNRVCMCITYEVP